MTTRLSDEKSPSIEKDSPVLSTKDLEASEPIVRYANPLDDPQFASIDEKKLLRKIDMRLIPWLSFLYLLSFLDRSAIGNARLYGLAADIGATPHQINLAVSMFFISYAFFEVPSNVLLKKLKPSVWFAFITVLVGVCMAAQGLVRNNGQLIATRVLLGVVEAGLYPGCNFLMSGWYKKKEFGIRAALFFSMATASGAFGGLLSALLVKMDGVGNYEGWRWIFIVIGIVTFLAGVASYWLVLDFPAEAKHLTELERKFVIARLQSDQQFAAAGEGFKWRSIQQAFLDWKTWVGALIFTGCVGPLYSFSLFTPTIVQQLGYRSPTKANLISVPIYVLACFFTVGIGFYADRKGHRALLGASCGCLGIIAYIVLIVSKTPALSYAFIYLAAIAIYPQIPNTVALTSTGIEGGYKRSVVMGFVISFGNINGAGSSSLYRATDRPFYRFGHSFVLLFVAVGLIATLIFWFGVRRENMRRERGECTETILTNDDSSLEEVEAAIIEAAKIRREEKAALLSKGGLMNRIRAVYYEFDMRDGGTYATDAESKELKGDWHSSFRYNY